MDAGKAVAEADSEISEAIDFANYYARRIQSDGAQLVPFGTVLVTPPWNFPYAIPCGGVLAALVAGNTVILKPAPESILTAWVMVRALWRAGIPRDVLQFVPCPDDDTGRALVTDDRIGAVVLTGACETARMFLGWKPTLHLFGETSGKNSLIITATADPDQAVKDLVKSAFGHAGQKCSAASLAIVEAEVYDHPGFRRQLRDAAASLVAGQSWNFDAVATPIMMEPSDELHRALTTLDPGEEWLLKPAMLENNPCLWTPGIKLGVKPDSWFRNTETFGPVLGVIRADDLDHAIHIQNDSDFGLTGGIHSLDDREITRWMESVQVGNAYVNRSITGAIVQRQPFGGWKRSCYGPGAKAGGPNHAAQFGRWKNQSLPAMTAACPEPIKDLLDQLVTRLPEAAETLTAAAGSDAFWNTHEFSVTHDPTALVGEANLFRYRHFSRALIRVSSEISDGDVARLILAATAIGVPFTLSMATERPWLSETGVTVRIESTASLLERFAQIAAEFELIRSPLGEVDLKTAAIAAGMRWADGPVVWNARVEWPVWFREQAVSRTLHRYGNIIASPSDLSNAPRKSLRASHPVAQ
jgi:RHH-type proline utilization regulon transcriptional repressor/proline dehydrogenase/delta 1-pyrroline-5-carboxylate dehydrogenase